MTCCDFFPAGSAAADETREASVNFDFAVNSEKPSKDAAQSHQGCLLPFLSSIILLAAAAFVSIFAYILVHDHPPRGNDPRGEGECTKTGADYRLWGCG